MNGKGRLYGKTAIITGAGSGIGRAIAIRFGKEGCNLGLVDINQKGLQETEEIVSEMDVSCLSYSNDITQRDQVEYLVNHFFSENNQCNILVNCVGIFSGNPYEAITDCDWEKIIKINLTSFFITSQVVIKRWLRDGAEGVIINIGSVSGERSNPGAVSYCVTKAGVASLSRGIALEYGDRGIRAVTLAPGFIETPLTRPQMDDPAILAKWEDHIAMRRLGNPEEIANAALFLASDEASYITGHTYFVDGGYLLV